MKKILLYILFISTVAVIIASCSTTKKLTGDEVLYTGVKKLEIKSIDSTKIPSEVKDQIFNVINVKPNNSLYSPYIRSPFPIGLWVYNSIDDKTQNGFKHWIYEKFAETPVLISDVRPQLRMEMLGTVLDNNGYFGADTKYSILYDKNNKKKARINYTVVLPEPYLLSDIEYLEDTTGLNHKIDSIAKKLPYLKTGQRYCLDSLNMVRTTIANTLRNYGYYFFQPSYIEFLADSTITPQRIAIRMNLIPNIPAATLKKYKTGKIETTVNRNRGGGYPDTIMTKRGKVIQMKPSHLRKNLIPSCITFREGKTFSVRDMNTTQNYLSRLGIFNAISIDVTPLDSLKGRDSLDVYINCTFDAPIEASIELDGTIKSSNYIGPGLTLGLSHNNIFGGGEKLSINLTSAYEWLIGGNKSASNNSYEFGLSSSLRFPRLLAPPFIRRIRRNLNWTQINLSASILNRPNYFKLAKFETSFGYEWYSNRYSLHELKLIKLTYSKPISINPKIYDSILEGDNEHAGTIGALTILDPIFIPQISYTYTYDRAFGKHKENNLNWSFTVSEAGNLIGAITGWSKEVNDKKLFGTPYSQFVKGQTQLVYGRCIGGENWIVSRILVGAAHPYANSRFLPFTEEFYVGGANSLRAFSPRSIGPGNFNPNNPPSFGIPYYSQGGTFKFEMNVEYRFPIFGIIKGALFVDTGNVWNFKSIFIDLQDYDSTNDQIKMTDIGVLKGKNFFKELALDVGAGLRLDFGILVFRADLGVGIHLPYDTGKSGYYNIPSFKNSLGLHLAIGYPF